MTNGRTKAKRIKKLRACTHPDEFVIQSFSEPHGWRICPQCGPLGVATVVDDPEVRYGDFEPVEDPREVIA
jgi:hypothetical protein